MKELSATSEAKVVAAAVAHYPLALPNSDEDKMSPKQVPPVSTPLGQKNSPPLIPKLCTHEVLDHHMSPLLMDLMARILFPHCSDVNKL